MTLDHDQQFCDAKTLRAKVYCKDCVFFGWRGEGVLRREAHQRCEDSEAVCHHPHAQQDSTDWYGGRVPPAVRNAHQDCPDFRRHTWRDDLARIGILVAMVACAISAGLIMYALR